MTSSVEATEIITRVLYQAPLVHVYAIPPLQSNRGHVASAWTASPQNEIFTARIKITERSDPTASSTSASTLSPPGSTSAKPGIMVTILLEDPQSSELFAESPYTTPSVVEATIDSSRFFAIRVTGEGGRKAVLGIGFEERGEALDFSIALQDARKILGLEAVTPTTSSTPRSAGLVAGMGSSSRNARGASGRSRPEPVATLKEEETLPVKRDWSLKEGQMLHVDIGGRNKGADEKRDIEPPSGGGLMTGSGIEFSLLPPPPSAKEVREEQRTGFDDAAATKKQTLQELGFDDGEFGEFQ